MTIPARAVAVLLALSVGWGASTARGEFVATLAVAVSPEAGGLTRYEYTVAVDSTSTLPAVQFDLAVADDADLQTVETPTGWSFDYDAGGGSISFFTDDADALIAPGSSASFAFLSRSGPSAMDYFLVGDSIPPALIEGVIAAPGVAIPEPSSWALSLAAVGIGLLGARRGRAVRG